MKTQINFTEIVADVKAEINLFINIEWLPYSTWKVKSHYTLTKIDEAGERTRETFTHFFKTHNEDLVHPAEDNEDYNKRNARLAEMMIEEVKDKIAEEITEFYGFDLNSPEFYEILSEF